MTETIELARPHIYGWLKATNGVAKRRFELNDDPYFQEVVIMIGDSSNQGRTFSPMTVIVKDGRFQYLGIFKEFFDDKRANHGDEVSRLNHLVKRCTEIGP